MDKFNFLYPRSRYFGSVSPENLVFNANLQEFATHVGYIAALNSNGKLTPQEAYGEVKSLWQMLKSSKKSLGVGAQPFQDPEVEH